MPRFRKHDIELARGEAEARRAAESLRLILADRRFQEIQVALLALHGFDLGAELEAALRHHENG
jgi:hypothetical protein